MTEQKVDNEMMEIIDKVSSCEKSVKLNEVVYLLMENAMNLLDVKANPQLNELFDKVDQDSTEANVPPRQVFIEGERVMINSIMTSLYLTLVATDEEREDFKNMMRKEEHDA